jgi:cytochrome P450
MQLDDRIADPRTYADLAQVDAIFGELRRDDPLHWTAPATARPFWTVTKHADIIEISRQNHHFLNEPRAVLFSIAQEEEVRRHAGEQKHLIRSLVRIDDPDHRALRNLTQSWFMPAQVNKLAPRIEAIATELIDEMAQRETCDFANEIANWFPLRVILSILGLGREDEPRMLKLTKELFGPRDPDVQRTPTTVTFKETVAEFERFFSALSAARRAEPRDDIASVIANAEINGGPITDRDANGYYITIATAGHDTTSATLAGGLLALIQRPDQLKKLQADPSLIPRAVEEMIRWVTPIRHFMRTATVDYEMRGKKIAAGEALFLAYPSGNRDEEIFDDPFAFRHDRTPNRHLAFGFGAHQCLGMSLARLELATFLRLLLPRLDEIALDGDPGWIQSNFVQGMKRLPIRYRMSGAPQA